MGRLWLAFRLFFQVLFSAERANQMRALESAPPPSAQSPAPPPEPAPALPPSGRSDALSLLETLQREARLLDFLQEDIASYSDQQVGSAVREVHRACGGVLERLIGIAPVVSTQEGSQVTVGAEDSAARFRLVGRVADRPATGTLVHAGWRAQRCDIPHWSGPEDARLILAPAEVEIA
jgi:hypothetical protein